MAATDSTDVQPDLQHGLWRVLRWPPCAFHVFLSYSSEDRDTLVEPVVSALGNAGFSPWYDRREHPLGTPVFEALREGVLKARHIVYFLTDAAVRRSRGWMDVERTYAERVQGYLRQDDVELTRLELPLVFVPRRDESLLRSIWGPLLDRAAFHEDAAQGVSSSQWAAETIVSFIEQEERRGLDVWEDLTQSNLMHPRFAKGDELTRRLRCERPVRLTPDIDHPGTPG